MKPITNKIIPSVLALCAGLLINGALKAQGDPTDGFAQYNNTYNVQNWTSGCGGFADLGGGEFETWVCAGESRVEMRWANWPNQNTANQFVCDAMFDANTQATAIHQIKSNTGGEVIYLQVQAPGTLRNDNGSVFATGMANQWFHINSIFDPTTGQAYAYINGALQVTRSYPTSDRAWYFKNGCYNNGLPSGGKSTAWFKNISSWVKSSSPDFTISASPSSQTVTAGGGTSYTVTTTAVNGFSSGVSLTVSGLPSGASGSFNPTSITGAGSSTLSITTSASTPAGTNTLTIQGVSGSLTHTATVTLVVNPSVHGTTVSFEAENVAVTSSGPATSVQTDANSSNGKWVELASTATGQWMQFTTPTVTPGTYSVQMEWKGNNNRGQLALSVDGGAQLGGTLDQYSASQSYPTTTFGNVTFATSGTHTIRLTVKGKNSSSSGYYLSADKFTLVAQ